MQFCFSRTEIQEVVMIKRKIFSDLRGILIKEFEITPFANYFPTEFQEEYVSISKKNVLRGLHFQRDPKPQGKYLSVLSGKIFDVAVDLRVDSPTYLKHVANVLSSETSDAVWVPAGFAHGFLALEDNTVVFNRCTNEYNSFLEAGLRWDDPNLNIKWPIMNPILSEKDKSWEFV